MTRAFLGQRALESDNPMLPNRTLTNIVTVSLRNFQYKCGCHHSKPINAREVTKLL